MTCNSCRGRKHLSLCYCPVWATQGCCPYCKGTGEISEVKMDHGKLHDCPKCKALRRVVVEGDTIKCVLCDTKLPNVDLESIPSGTTVTFAPATNYRAPIDAEFGVKVGNQVRTDDDDEEPDTDPGGTIAIEFNELKYREALEHVVQTEPFPLPEKVTDIRDFLSRRGTARE